MCLKTSDSLACLLQIALKESVLLIDIYTLIHNVCAEHIKIFFEMFLGCDADRIVFDFRSDLSLLRRTFNWMPEYLQRVQPKFHCVQRFVKLVGTSDTYKEIFETVPNPSLKEVAAKWLEKDLSKGERQGNNLLKRPLSKGKMICAAKNARATMDLYYFIQKKLAERNLHDDMSTLIVIPKQIDRKRIKRKNGETESMDEIYENIEAKIKEMKETLYTFEKSENITIVIDSGFLFIAPFLQQFGYKTFDQRNCENGEHFSRDEVVAALSKFMEDRIADGTITHCYLLTDEYSNIRVRCFFFVVEQKPRGIPQTSLSVTL
uniref:3'-5' exonuclease domain-containing protein n=1 Tax=Panagrolaimus davidi TaxID=227884 RepID=A0A914Q369_9BILA